MVPERQRHGSGEVLDRGDLLEDLLQAGGVGHVLRPSPARRPRPWPSSARCRAASRSCPSAARGGWAPPAAHGSCRRRHGRRPGGWRWIRGGSRCCGTRCCGTRCCGTRCCRTRCSRRPRGVLPQACGRFCACRAPHELLSRGRRMGTAKRQHTPGGREHPSPASFGSLRGVPRAARLGRGTGDGRQPGLGLMSRMEVQAVPRQGTRPHLACPEQRAGRRDGPPTVAGPGRGTTGSGAPAGPREQSHDEQTHDGQTHDGDGPWRTRPRRRGGS